MLSDLNRSGFVVENRTIMTNAHLVADQTRLLVRRHGWDGRTGCYILTGFLSPTGTWRLCIKSTIPSHAVSACRNPKRFVASVLAVCHECDLALVTVNDDAFWEGLKPLTLGGIPQLRVSGYFLSHGTTLGGAKQTGTVTRTWRHLHPSPSNAWGLCLRKLWLSLAIQQEATS